MRATTVAALAGLLVSAASLMPGLVCAQEARGMSVAQIERLFAAGVGATQILQTAREACIDFRLDAPLEQRLTRAGANAEFLAALRQVCFRGPAPTPTPQPQPQPQPRVPAAPPPAQPRYNPGSAMTRSLIVPGLGQFYTGRPAIGAAFLTAWAAALGLAVLTQEVTIECLERVTDDDECPSSQIRDKVTTRPMLAIGAGGALAIAVLSALEAKSAATRANRSGPSGDGSGNDASLGPWAFAINPQPDGAVAVGFRIRFR